MTRRAIPLALAAAVQAGLWTQAAAATAEPRDPVAACAERLHAAGVFSGAYLGVTGDGRVFASGAVGGPTPETPFNIGSLGKLFTAVAIGQLVDAGRLRFDDPVGKHLPDLPPAFAGLTVDQLLTHRAGLGDYLRPANRPAISAARRARDLLPLVLAEPPRTPGTYAYSNSGYVLLGVLIEALTGQTYADYVAARLFGPAGMERSSLTPPPDAATPMTRAVLLAPGSPPPAPDRPASPRPPTPGETASPAGGTWSTAADLVRFAAALADGRLVRPETLRALVEPRVAIDGGERRPGAPVVEAGAMTGYGFNTIPLGRVTAVGHGGGGPGVNAQLDLYGLGGETLKIAVILSNFDPPGATLLARFWRGQIAERPVPCETTP